MKKKIATLLDDNRLIGNANVEALQKAYRLFKSKLQKAKAAKTKAKLAFQNHAAESGKKDQDTLLVLRTEFYQAKAMQEYQRLGYELAKFRLTKWLENWAREMAEPQEWVLNNPQKGEKKAKKAAKPAIVPEDLPTSPKKKNTKATSKKEKASDDTDA
jgi:hypothetical protein